MAKIEAKAGVKMENVLMTESEEQEFAEYKRKKKEIELYDRISKIEMSLLKSGVTFAELRDFCASALKLQPHGICVSSPYLRFCKDYFKKNNLPMCCKISEDTSSEVKFYECKKALFLGAKELEYTPDLFAIKNGNYALVKKEIKKIVRLARDKTVKVNLQCAALSKEQAHRAAQVAASAGVRVICVNADEESVQELASALRGKCFIQANGVTNYDEFMQMSKLNCVRVSTDRAEPIVMQLLQNSTAD